MSDLGDEYTPSEARTIRIFDRLKTRIGAIIMTSAEDAVTKSADQLDKAYGEVSAQNDELKAVIEELRKQAVSPELVTRLEGVSQKFDDLNPDAPAPEPTPEPPVEPPAG